MSTLHNILFFKAFFQLGLLWDKKRSFQQFILLYSWPFSRYSAPIHWLVHGHMTSNNETVSRQMPRAGNIAKTMTSNGKQFTVTREMLTAVARDQSVQLKMAWFCRRNPSAFFQICFCFVLLYNKSLNDWSLGKQWILFPSGPVTKCLMFITCTNILAILHTKWPLKHVELFLPNQEKIDLWFQGGNGQKTLMQTKWKKKF